MAEDSKTKQIENRLDVCEAALEAAGYLVWNKKKACFERPAAGEPAAPAPAKAEAE